MTPRYFHAGLFLVALALSFSSSSSVYAQASPSGMTFVVKDGAFPWSDQVSIWQLADVPPSVEGNGPLPQQNCGSRAIAVPDGAKYIIFGVRNEDIDKFKIDYPEAKPTGDLISVIHPDGSAKLFYTIYKLANPASSVGDKELRAGLIILQIDDKPSATAVPSPASGK